MTQLTPEILELSLRPKNVGIAANADGFGADVDLACGSVVRFSISLSIDGKAVTGVRFNSNGCGYMVAVADALSSHLSGRHLNSLGGLQQIDLAETISTIVGPIPHERGHCAATCIAAVRTAFANCRERRIAGFHGDDPLICSCFGVGENTIRAVIEQNNADSVDAVTTACNAGGGCGSCRMLIQELIDSVIEPI